MLIKIYKSFLISLFFSFFTLTKHEILENSLLALDELKLTTFFAISYNDLFCYKSPRLFEEDIKNLKESGIELYAYLIFDAYDVIYRFENNDDLQEAFDIFKNNRRQAHYIALCHSGPRREIQVEKERICSLRNIMKAIYYRFAH